MKVYCIVIISIFFYTKEARSQDPVLEKEINISEVFKSSSDSYDYALLTDPKDSLNVLFLIGRQFAASNTLMISGLQFHSNFEDHISSVYSEKVLSTSYNQLLGGICKKNISSLFLSKKSKKEFSILSIDFENGTSKVIGIDLKLKKEILIGSASHNGSFYLFSVRKSSSILVMREFNEKGEFQIQDFDLSKNSGGGSFYNLYFELGSGLPLKFDIVNMGSLPYDLHESSKAHKFYAENSKCYLTIDNQHRYTSLITIDLEDKEVMVKKLPTAFKGGSGLNRRSNSFISKDRMFQASVSRYYFALQIRDLNSDSILSTHSFSPGDDIYFRNSDLTKEKNVMINTKPKSLDTDSFLKKLSASDISLFGRLYDGNIAMTLGGFKDQSASGAPIGSIGPVFVSIDSQASRDVYFRSYFDLEKGKHIEGEVPSSIGGRMATLKARKSITAELSAVFTLNDKYYLGCFDKGSTYQIFELDAIPKDDKDFSDSF